MEKLKSASQSRIQMSSLAERWHCGMHLEMWLVAWLLPPSPPPHLHNATFPLKEKRGVRGSDKITFLTCMLECSLFIFTLCSESRTLLVTIPLTRWNYYSLLPKSMVEHLSMSFMRNSALQCWLNPSNAEATLVHGRKM